MSSLVHCIYTSQQAHPLSQAAIDKLVRSSRENNTRHGITGILLHVGGSFMQVLEGEPHVVDELYAKILVDSRHTAITRIILEAIPRRYFGDSIMSLATLSPAELAEALEFGDDEQREVVLASLDEGRAKKLLRAFSEGRWRHRIAVAEVSPA